MLRKAIPIIVAGLLSVSSLLGQQDQGKWNFWDSYYKRYIGTTASMLGNLFPDPPSLVQLNIGYWVTDRDVVSLEAITWKYPAPLGIPYGSSFGEESEEYPGSIREYGVGVVYQRFLWKGLYTSLQVVPFRRIYLDEDNETIQKGFQLFSTLRLGYHVPLFNNRFFIEPSIAATYWPVSTNVPAEFKAKDDKWNNYFLGEPGLHLGFKF
jgi:hypothetical protein